MIETQISILIQLARMDNEIHEKEKNMIHKIGVSHGLDEEKIQDLIDNPPRVTYANLENDERFDMLCRVVQLMKVDGKVFDEEILYCMDVAHKLGYPLEAVMELYGVIHANLKLSTEINVLKKKYRDYKLIPD